MGKMKKILAALTAGVLCMGAVPLSAASLPEAVLSVSAVESTYENLTYTTEENGTVTITGCSADVSGELELPAEIGGKSVTRIGDSAFQGNTAITGVSVPDSVTSIGDSAFAGCPKLTSVTIPDSVTSLGDSVFSGCSALTEAVVPAGITEIGEYLFWGCTSLEKVQLPESITSVGEYAFDQCDALTDVYFGGTQEAWNMVSVGFCNDALTGAVLHYGESLPVEKTAYPKGDLDNDGKIDTSDIFAAMVYVAYKGAGLDSGATPEQIAAADIDGDGKVDSTDIYYMLYYVALHGAGQKVSWEDVIS